MRNIREKCPLTRENGGCEHTKLPESEGTFSMRSCHSLDRMAVTFDDEHAVANAGLIAPATLAQHLGLRELFESHVDLGDAPGRANVGHKAMTVIHSALAGGDCIDDADALAGRVHTRRCWATGCGPPRRWARSCAASPGATPASSTRWPAELLARAWAAGAGPGDDPVTIDVDSTICETYGLAKQGGPVRHTNVRGYHPLLAVIAGTDEVVGARLRGGNAHSGRGAAGFLTETFSRVRAAGATGPLTLRADSGFYSRKVVDACRKAAVRYSITAKLHKGACTRLSPPSTSRLDADPVLPRRRRCGRDHLPALRQKAQRVRLIVRRVKPTPGSQLALLATYAYHAFITDRAGDTLELEADHRRHAEVEDAIRDLKYGVGLNHLPSGRFGANAAWLDLNVIAHNLARWTSRIGLGETLITTDTLRRRHLDPARPTHPLGRQPLCTCPNAGPGPSIQHRPDNLRAVVLVT